MLTVVLFVGAAVLGAQPVGGGEGTGNGRGGPPDRGWACRAYSAGLRDGDNVQTWPGGVVPFVFDAGLYEIDRLRVRAAMAQIEAQARVRFIERTTETDCLVIRRDVINSSFVGRIGGLQPVGITDWDQRFIIVHELMHALGLWHEHQRADRDAYVDVQLGNVDPTFVHAFEEVPTALRDLPYDFDSVMHYDRCSFSACIPCHGPDCWTITVRPPHQAWQFEIGQLTHLSAGDVMRLASLYGEPECPRPLILRHPSRVGLTVESGQTVSLSITADQAGGPLTYGWRRDGIPLSNGGAVSGVTTPVLTISGVRQLDSGVYDVVVANACGAVASGGRGLAVTCRADHDWDGVITPNDLTAFINDWFYGVQTGSFEADFDYNGAIEPVDLAGYVQAWFAQRMNGC